MGIVISGTTNDILVNGVSVATDTEVSSAVAPLASTTYVDAQDALRGRLVQGTAVNSTSGTFIDFTGIPNWVKRITVMFNGVSTSGTSQWLIQLGYSGGIETTGYVSASSRCSSTSVQTSVSTAGFLVRGDTGIIGNVSGLVTICNVSGNVWSSNYTLGSQATIDTIIGGGSKTTTGVLDRVRITTVNGTDTFDAGSINIMYEG